MKAGNVTAVRTIRATFLGVLVLLAGIPASAQTPDAACLADSLYLISPDVIDLQLQSEGRPGMIISWPDMALSDATCYALTVTEDAEFEAEVTGGYGGLVDRSFLFTTNDGGGTIGAAQSEPLLYNWRSDGPSYYGSVGGTLNLANNGGVWRYDAMEGTWSQVNSGLPMTWPQTNVLAFAEADDGAMVAAFASGSNLTTSPEGLWIHRGAGWAQVGEEHFGSENMVTAVAFAPGSSQRFAVGTSSMGLFVTADGGETFTQWTMELDPTSESLPTVYRVSALMWTGTRLAAAVSNFGLFISEDNGASFTNSDIAVIRDLDATRASSESGGLLGGDIYRMRGTIELDMTGTDLRAEPTLDEYGRVMSLPLLLEMHAAPRAAGDAVQDFDVQLMSLEGRLLGDSDFDVFEISAGDSLGLPSPGNLTATRLPDSKFLIEGWVDVNLSVHIEGHPRGPFAGITGTTTGVARFTLAGGAGTCTVADNGQGTIDLPPQCADGLLGSFTLDAGFPAGVSLDVDADLNGYQETMVLPMINDLAEDPSNPDHLVAGVNFHGIMESDNGGYTWHDLSGDLIVPSDEIDGAWVHNGISVVVDPGDSDILLAGLRQEGIYRTDDGGLTWVEVAGENVSGTVQPSNLGALVDMVIRADDSRPGVYYAAEDKWSLLASYDYGVTWSHFGDQPVMNTALAFEMSSDGSGDLLLGTWGGGMYVPGSPLALSDTYNSDTDFELRETLDLGLSISFTAGAVADLDSLYLKCQTFQGWAVWRATGTARESLTLLGLFDRVNPETCIEGYCGDESYDMKPQCFISKRAACFDFSTPDTIRFFDDEVYNGFDYFYGVTSFDYGSTALTTPENNSQAMLFSPRWQGDGASPFWGGGNTQPYQVNMIAAPAADTYGVEDIYVYPNPLRASEGLPNLEGRQVVFTNLPPESLIQIFTPAGDKVIELGPELQEGGNIHWNTRNEEEEEVTSGVFLYKVIMSAREDFWGKLIIIR